MPTSTLHVFRSHTSSPFRGNRRWSRTLAPPTRVRMEWYLMQRSNLLLMAWLAGRWLCPLMAVFMLSTLITSTAAVLFGRVGAIESTATSANAPQVEPLRAGAELRPVLSPSSEPEAPACELSARTIQTLLPI